jgi:hypothetical protein
VTTTFHSSMFRVWLLFCPTICDHIGSWIIVTKKLSIVNNAIYIGFILTCDSRSTGCDDDVSLEHVPSVAVVLSNEMRRHWLLDNNNKKLSIVNNPNYIAFILTCNSRSTGCDDDVSLEHVPSVAVVLSNEMRRHWLLDQ